MASKVDQRRLRDGAKAGAANADYKSMSDAELREAKDNLHDGIAALQSLDDLGSPEANNAAWQDMLALSKKHDLVKKEMRRRGIE
jgi:hypothetical protein